MKPATTAILSALAEEQQGLLELMLQPRRVTRAGRDFWLGDLHGQPVVLALSRIGKVAAATTATTLIEAFGAQRLIRPPQLFSGNPSRCPRFFTGAKIASTSARSC